MTIQSRNTQFDSEVDVNTLCGQTLLLGLKSYNTSQLISIIHPVTKAHVRTDPSVFIREEGEELQTKTHYIEELKERVSISTEGSNFLITIERGAGGRLSTPIERYSVLVSKEDIESLSEYYGKAAAFLRIFPKPTPLFSFTYKGKGFQINQLNFLKRWFTLPSRLLKV